MKATHTYTQIDIHTHTHTHMLTYAGSFQLMQKKDLKNSFVKTYLSVVKW
jgi:hypothetical protein